MVCLSKTIGAALLAGAVAWAPVSAPVRATVVRGETEGMDLDLDDMTNLFDAADPEGAEEKRLAGEAASAAAAAKADMYAAAANALPEGASAPFGFWDPAGLTKLGVPATQAWFKHAELKHSRVAMAATVGWIVNEAGIVFPGDIATGVPFASLGKGWDAWAAVPDAGKVQILFVMGTIELASEAVKPHYMSGGTPGQSDGPLGLRFWDPLGSTKDYDLATKAVKRQRELNNGRLAMIGAASFFSAAFIENSVPALPAGW